MMVCVLSCFSLCTLCNPKDCNLPGRSVHWILQARILEWVAMPCFMESSQPRDQTHVSYVSCISSLVFHWASLVAQLVKNLSAILQTWVQSLGWKIRWRREMLPTPVFWPGEFHRLYSPWGLKESDMTERLSLFFTTSTTIC